MTIDRKTEYKSAKFNLDLLMPEKELTANQAQIVEVRKSIVED
jgi:hypothetical protein